MEGYEELQRKQQDVSTFAFIYTVGWFTSQSCLGTPGVCVCGGRGHGELQHKQPYGVTVIVLVTRTDGVTVTQCWTKLDTL